MGYRLWMITYHFCVFLLDSSHHCDSATSVICQIAGLSLAAAAAQRTSGNLHQDPCYDRSHTHAHIYTQAHTCAQLCQYCFITVCFSSSKESFHLSSSGPGGSDQLHAIHLGSQLSVPLQPKLQVLNPFIKTYCSQQPMGLQKHH